MALDASDIAARVLAALPASDARPAREALVPTIEVGATEMPQVLAFLRDEPGLECRLFVDATAVDREAAGGLIEVIYVVRSIVSFSDSIVVKTAVDAADPVMPTSSGVYAGANWAEREIYDMFGVRFEGHPDLRRILMYPEFEGHPLRKSYPYQKRQPLVPERDPLANPWPKRHGGV
ncbi:MAG: NADH-quinone oxidoreductase subunit C [Candidatus Binatia bacterium]